MDTQPAQTASAQNDSAVPVNGLLPADQANDTGAQQATGLPVDLAIRTQPIVDPLANAQASLQPSPQQVAPPPLQDLGAVASALPQAVSDAANASLNPANATSVRGAAAKEQASDTVLDSLAKDLPGAQAVEQERTPEISPELETWMERVEHHEERAPENVVVADKTSANPTGTYAAEPVVVLPMTQSDVQQGMKHPITDSVKWLAVWCVRIMKKFRGSVVYRHAPSETPNEMPSAK